MCETTAQPPVVRPWTTFGTPILKGLNAALWFIARGREQSPLGALDERLLRDVGIPPDDACLGAARPFWWP